MTEKDNIIRWNMPPRDREGTLADYIEEHYPYYADRGLYTWESILDYLKVTKYGFEEI